MCPGVLNPYLAISGGFLAEHPSSLWCEMVARRLLIVLAVLLGLTALAAGVAPREDLRGGGTPSPTPSAPAPHATPSETVKKTIDADATGQRVVVRKGQILELTVESGTLATVSLDDAGIHTAEPDSPAQFELLADVPGSYAIDDLEADRRIGTLEIRDVR